MPTDNASAASGAPLTLYLLHALGASSGSFDRLAEKLDDDVRVQGIDLPGFGSAASAPDATLDETVEHVLRHLAGHANGPWMLGGHSMGGKIAALVAARVLRGDAPLFGLRGMVLMAPSPPRPEPMDEERRERMLSWVDGGAISEQDAETFIDQNTAEPLDAGAHSLALADLRRTSPTAWRAWLETGSRVDATAEVQTLDIPVLVLAGTDDADLGAAAQPELLASVYPRARFTTFPDTGHMIPLERPAEAAAAISRFIADEVRVGPVVPDDWARLIAGDRVDARVRGILARRSLPDDRGYAPAVLDLAQLTLLREIADLVVPQEGPAIDIAGRVDAQLARGEGDGWRHADLPIDAEAYRTGLDQMAAACPPTRRSVPRPSAPPSRERRMRGPLRRHPAESVARGRAQRPRRQWLAHPASMARVGYDGFATGGRPIRGFVELRLGRREDWEPANVGGTIATGDAA